MTEERKIELSSEQIDVLRGAIQAAINVNYDITEGHQPIPNGSTLSRELAKALDGARTTLDILGMSSEDAVDALNVCDLHRDDEVASKKYTNNRQTLVNLGMRI